MNSVNRLVSAVVELSRDTIKKNIKTQYKGNDKQTQDTTGTHELVLKTSGCCWHSSVESTVSHSRMATAYTGNMGLNDIIRKWYTQLMVVWRRVESDSLGGSYCVTCTQE